MNMQTSTATKKLLIGNLPETAHSQTVEDLFKSVGRVLSVAVLRNGFAFVDMKADDADRALRELRGTRLDGKLVLIDRA